MVSGLMTNTLLDSWMKRETRKLSHFLLVSHLEYLSSSCFLKGLQEKERPDYCVIIWEWEKGKVVSWKGGWEAIGR